MRICCTTHSNFTRSYDKLQFPVPLIHFTAHKTKLLSRWKLSHCCAPTATVGTSLIKEDSDVAKEQWLGSSAEPNIFLGICTHTHTIIISSDPCPPMLFKLRPCIQKWCNVYYPHTPSLSWIGQTKGRSMSLASTRSASWLAYSLHSRSLTLIWSWMQECTKPMPTHEQQHRTHAHPKPMGMGGRGHGHGHPM